jgi:hypothetical protein
MWFWPVNEMIELVSGMPASQFRDESSWVRGSELVQVSSGSVRCLCVPHNMSSLVPQWYAYTRLKNTDLQESNIIRRVNVRQLNKKIKKMFYMYLRDLLKLLARTGTIHHFWVLRRAFGSVREEAPVPKLNNERHHNFKHRDILQRCQVEEYNIVRGGGG